MGMESHDVRMNGSHDRKRTAKSFLMREWPLCPYTYGKIVFDEGMALMTVYVRKNRFWWGNGPYDCIRTAKPFLMREWPLWPYTYVKILLDEGLNDPYDRERTAKYFLMENRLKTKNSLLNNNSPWQLPPSQFPSCAHHLGLLNREEPDGNGGCVCSRDLIGGNWEPWRLLRILQVRTGVNVWGIQEAIWDGGICHDVRWLDA